MLPRVTICLPTWNGERHLERLLPRLAEQVIEGGLEIVALDSSSTDRTRELLAASGARTEVIETGAFRHGRARNQLARMARGNVLVFLSQDALPRDRDTLARLVAACSETGTACGEPGTAGATARVLPHPEDDALTARTVIEAPEGSAEARVYEPASVGAAAVRFNNVASAIRADVLRAIPFPDVEFGEDAAWAARALEAGHRIRFVPEAVVLHAHRYTARSAFERYRTDAEFHARVHGRRVRPSLWSALTGLAHELRADWRFIRREHRPMSALLRAPALRGAQVWGQYVGSRAR
jgi:rhamnosyltransferase